MKTVKKYEKVLKIYRELAKENPQTYLSDVVIALRNLVYLHLAKNEFPLALEKHEEALKILRELTIENPQKFDIDYAQMLVVSDFIKARII
jgi:tetratricopeptide (TPR) repeat protein